MTEIITTAASGNGGKKARPNKRLVIGISAMVVLGLLIAGGFAVANGGKDAKDIANQKSLYKVKRGTLIVDVTESGEIKALNSVDVKSEVEGRTKIISIVDEGTFITAEDVNNGLVLVELDSSEIQQRLTQQEITFLNATASLTDANEAMEIQRKQNNSDIKKGQMEVRFAMMDLQKYVGENVAQMLAETLNEGAHVDSTSLLSDPNTHDILGGEALQKLRDLDSDISLQKQDLELAINKLDWTLKLYEKNFVSQNEKEADELDKQRKEIALEKALTAKQLFVKYEFPKECETRLNKCEESRRELERIEAGARSKLAQADARLQSAQATFGLQKTLLEKLRRQLVACIIKAPAVGQVVYSSSADEWRRQNQPIQIGADIQERQDIITIPDPCEMKVEIKIHENWINKVRLNQKAQITVSAFPDERFAGEVMKKSPLADNSRWWMNPDLKAYITDVSIEGNNSNLKTGMSAKVRIIIDQLDDVVYVPVQTVVNKAGKKVCYVQTSNGLEEREVDTGAFNTGFVEIKRGLAEGEYVTMTPMRGGPSEKNEPADEKKETATESKIVQETGN